MFHSTNLRTEDEDLKVGRVLGVSHAQFETSCTVCARIRSTTKWLAQVSLLYIYIHFELSVGKSSCTAIDRLVKGWKESIRPL